MTQLALHFQRSRMHLMTERNGLLGRGRLRERNTNCNRERNENPDQVLPRIHSAPVRICSAIYSEDRMESDRMVMVGF